VFEVPSSSSCPWIWRENLPSTCRAPTIRRGYSVTPGSVGCLFRRRSLQRLYKLFSIKRISLFTSSSVNINVSGLQARVATQDRSQNFKSYFLKTSPRLLGNFNLILVVSYSPISRHNRLTRDPGLTGFIESV